MGAHETGRVALMAIRPEYADAILSGVKRVEFRKRRLAPDVRLVLIYATSPVSKIIGKFRVGAVVDGTPDELWNSYGSVGEIAREDYCKYYIRSERAYGFLVEDAERLPLELPLSELSPSPAVPRSFSYLSGSVHYIGASLADPNQYELW